MGTYDVYRTDKGREEEGTWVAMLDGSRWKLRRSNSLAAQAARRAAEKPYDLMIKQAEARGGEVPSEAQDRINLEWTVSGLVVDWDGVTGPDGAALAFSAEACRTLLVDLPDLHLEVLKASMNVAHFQAAAVEAIAGNSRASSGTS